MASVRTDSFLLGINYWPARTAMGWWSDFDATEIKSDFLRIAAGGFDSVRLFLTWEEFQPDPHNVDPMMLRHLVAVADHALDNGLKIMPTLFTGHMSGVNWIPGWALGGSGGDGRFRVVSGGKVSTAGLRNWYGDTEVLKAQMLMAGRAAGALAGHQALWAWDLGNENSNCVVPANRTDGRRWLHEISNAIRREDGEATITLGLHMEDLEEDRNIGPAEAAEICDFLTMHGYPIYADWAKNATDEHILPFLAHITRWLSGTCDVLFSEFGAPTFRESSSLEGKRSVLVEEQEAAGYFKRALGVLREAGCLGAMVWCYTDYQEDIWGRPPLDEAAHERYFGVWRADGSPKPSLSAIGESAGMPRIDVPDVLNWIDIESDEFYLNPRIQLGRLYRRYRESDSSTSQ